VDGVAFRPSTVAGAANPILDNALQLQNIVAAVLIIGMAIPLAETMDMVNKAATVAPTARQTALAEDSMAMYVAMETVVVNCKLFIPCKRLS
jgi:hypothetical protein